MSLFNFENFTKIILSFPNVIISSLIMYFGLVDFKNMPVKAYWQPPDYIFGIVWPILYILFGIINLKVLDSNKHGYYVKENFILDSISEALVQNIWVVVTGLNYLPILYRYSIGSVILLLLNYISFERRNYMKKIDKSILILYLPYTFWILFALILNLQIVHKLVTT